MIGSRRPEPPVEVLEMLRQRGILVDAREGGDDRRKAVVLATMAAIRREKLTRQRRRWVTGGFVVAAAAVLGIAVRFEVRELRHQEVAASQAPAVVSAPGADLAATSGSVVATRSGQSTAISAGGHFRVVEGDSVRTGPDGAALLALPRGVRMELSAATAALVDRVSESEQRLVLDLGKTFVSVPKPGGPRTVEVVTPNARVVVHGTEFTVGVERFEPNHSVVTTVSVTRGSVLVIDGTGERFIAAGSSWSSAPPEIDAGREVSSKERSRPAVEHRLQARAASPVGASGVLGEQNRLFQSALDLRKAGDDAAMVRCLDEFLERFPRSTLEQEVRLARLRALSRLGRKSDAAAEARQYLSENPDVATRDEARRVLLEGTQSKASSP